MRFYTVGYAHWTAKALEERVRAMNAVLLDIRYSNYSRRAEFGGEALKQRFQPSYHHLMSWGNRNYRRSGIVIADFAGGLTIVRSWAYMNRPFVLMCGCADYDTCHRKVVADLLRAEGYEVEELQPGGRAVGIPALTLTQPYATLVAFGAKRIETRSWGTSYRGSLAIHAAKSFPPGTRAECFAEPFSTHLARLGILSQVNELPLGCVVAVADLVDCFQMSIAFVAGDPRLTDQERSFGYYSPGRYAWLLDNITPLSEPVPARGSLGLWTWEGAPA